MDVGGGEQAAGGLLEGPGEHAVTVGLVDAGSDLLDVIAGDLITSPSLRWHLNPNIEHALVDRPIGLIGLQGVVFAI